MTELTGVAELVVYKCRRHSRPLLVAKLWLDDDSRMYVDETTGRVAHMVMFHDRNDYQVELAKSLGKTTPDLYWGTTTIDRAHLEPLSTTWLAYCAECERHHEIRQRDVEVRVAEALRRGQRGDVKPVHVRV